MAQDSLTRTTRKESPSAAAVGMDLLDVLLGLVSFHCFSTTVCLSPRPLSGMAPVGSIRALWRAHASRRRGTLDRRSLRGSLYP
eukprot:4153694-Amphidinium_carterae.1